MRVGIPEALLFYKYEPFIRQFFDELGVDAVYSGPSNREILERGIKNCVDEACLPMKIFHGHVSKLREECDKIMVPRIMKCEYGESVCPKFAGLPELVKSGSGRNDLVFTSPLYLNDRGKLRKSLSGDGRLLGLSSDSVRKSLSKSYNNVFKVKDNIKSKNEYRFTVALLGHPYNLYDSFVNMNLVRKLERLGINAVTPDAVSHEDKQRQLTGLLKNPYWLFLRENYGAAVYFANEKKVDGIIYLSSFNCGTDSVTVEMIRNRIGNLPMMVLKLDEHTGEAGFDTRIEAFSELLERREKHADHFSQAWGQSHIRTAAVSGNRNGTGDSLTKQQQGT